jgi:hypothetical protein
MLTRPLLGLLCLGFLDGSLPANLSAQSDLDAFMEKVLARRDDNWKKLQQYVLEEKEGVRSHRARPLPALGHAPRIQLVHPRRHLRAQPDQRRRREALRGGSPESRRAMVAPAEESRRAREAKRRTTREG